MWNYIAEKRVKSYSGHVNEKFSIMADFHNGKYIISGSEDNKIYIWDLQTKEIASILDGHTGLLFN